ncbi:MAG: IMP dehydrogenase [Candidatus Spechtbacterales bacterium]
MAPKKNEFYDPPTALTFDDISLKPSDISHISSRRDERISLKSQISRNITLNIPAIASYMPTVCEADMAIAMAQIGGIGILHRWMTIEEQVRQVGLVKRQENRVIEDPYTISLTLPVSEIKMRMLNLKVGAFLVVDEAGRLLGVVSTRDVDFRDEEGLLAQDVMTPRKDLIVAPPGTNTDEAIRLFVEYRKEKIPVVDKDNIVRGLLSKKDVKKMRNKLAVRDADGHLLVAASIGLSKHDMLERTEALLGAGADLIVLAIANNYLGDALDAIKKLRRIFPDIDLAAGVVTEYEGTKMVFEAGADTVLVGIGPGSICETRIVAGVGVPQFTALRMAQRAAREKGKFIISDGGVRQPHHFAKALFAGASGTILGSVLAGTDESPGEKLVIEGKLVKFHRGLASDYAKQKMDEIQGITEQVNKEDLWEYVYRHVEAEGVESGSVPYTGSVIETLRRITGGLRSMMTYMGVTDIEGLWKRCDEGKYVRVTDAGSREGNPHDLVSFRS